MERGSPRPQFLPREDEKLGRVMCVIWGNDSKRERRRSGVSRQQILRRRQRLATPPPLPTPMEADAASPNSSHSSAPVRVVAIICPGGTGSFKVTARVMDSSAVVSLHEDTTRVPASRKDYDYRLDCCYHKDDDSCHQIFHSEVKPLVHAIFRGTNSCVVTCGAKTNLNTGQNTGLLTMTVEQILLHSQPINAVVSISSYHVLQDTHVFDLLEPKDSEVLVLEGADGRTNLKGLSRVQVKSIQEFVHLCCCSNNMLKHPTKPSDHLQTRGGHHGFIIYVSTFSQEGKECTLAKMNFLNLAGYIDPKQRTSGGGPALSNCNKAMYALMNVVQTLNSNQSFIPYRQSKLTRILQDSLCKTNNSVLIACLDEFSSQDAISTLSLASRSSQGVNHQDFSTSLGSALDKHSRPEFNRSAIKASRTPAADKRSKVIMHSAKKPASSLSTHTKQKSVKCILSGRKLFCPGTNFSKEDKRAAAPADVVKAQGCDTTKKVIEIDPCSMQEPTSSNMQEADSSSGLRTGHSCTDLEALLLSHVADDFVEETPVGATQSSPKLTDQLREISNTLKLIQTMPLSVAKQKSDVVGAQDVHTYSPEPITPTSHLKCGHPEDSDGLLKACTTVKKTLAKECLRFINSANKDQLKSLKGIGEKRANYILELREKSPEPFKVVDDLRNILGMNKNEIKALTSWMIMDS